MTSLRHHTVLRAALVAVSVALLSGCASTIGGVVLSKALDMVGLDLKKADTQSPEAALALQQALPKKVALRLHAGDTLNTDLEGRSLSVVVRIYKLRSANAFLSAPYKALGTAATEKEAFGTDLLDVRELVLTPGQQHEVLETMAPEATHLAVAALFRSPADQRWRFAFHVKESEKSGITIGVHGCALSVAAGATEGAQPETLRLAGVRCR